MLRTLFALCLVSACPLFSGAAGRQNVLFIITDDLNCNLGAYDHPIVQTPQLDKLADEGVTFMNAYANFPQCGQSRASFMTGLYPIQTGVTHHQQRFREYLPDVVTIPQHFMAHGYTAARVGKLYHYDNPSDIGTDGHDDLASWDTRINPRGIDKDIEPDIITLQEGKYGGTMSWLAGPGEDEDHTDGRVATESIKLLQQYAKSKQPFFLGVGLYKPHTPYVAPAKYWDFYDRDSIVVPEVPAGYLDTLPPHARNSLTRVKNQIDLPHEVAQEAIQAYYATITFMDAQVGRVLDALKETGLAENTIVVFTSDHGYHMGEHGYYQKRTLFEHSARVPLIIRAPGVTPAGKRSTSIVEMIDFYQTLSDLAGVPEPPEFVLGRSMRPVLKNPEKPFRPDALMRHEFGYSLRTARYRYMLWDDGESELYDHQSDPAEMKNLANVSSFAEVSSKLRSRIEARIIAAEIPAKNQRFIPPLPGDKGRPLDKS
ncbi:MAG: sulfatase [Opitutaceae bacterium]|nr:sulfatase [Opitutaceae bacterium]